MVLAGDEHVEVLARKVRRVLFDFPDYGAELLVVDLAELFVRSDFDKPSEALNVLHYFRHVAMQLLQ